MGRAHWLFHLDAKYIFATQACYNIFEFPMHMEWPAVYRLPIHLPGQQSIAFQADALVHHLCYCTTWILFMVSTMEHA